MTTQNNNFPALRFPEFSGDWGEKKLKDICSRIMDGTHFSPKSTEGTKKYLTSKNIRNEGLDFTNLNYISEEEHKSIYKRCPVKFGDVLLTKDGANTGNCCINTLNEEFSLLSSVAVLSGKEDLLDNVFLLQILQSSKGINTIDNVMAGQAISRITLEKINNFKFQFPQFSEQQKIAAFLRAIDEKIQQLARKKDLLKQYKKGVMQKIFNQEIRFKDDNGNDFADWEEKKLSELSENGFSNGIFNDPEKVGKGYRLINVKDMYVGNCIDINTLSFVDIDEKEFLKNKAEFGDIFFTRSSLVKEGIAHSNVNLSNAEDLTYDGHLIRMRPNKKLVSPIFLSYCLKTNAARKQFIKGGKTTTMTTIGQEEVSKVAINIPSFSEQQKIADFLSAIDDKINLVNQQLGKTKEYKKGLLQQMFV